jgi:hypothetical protein
MLVVELNLYFGVGVCKDLCKLMLVVELNLYFGVGVGAECSEAGGDGVEAAETPAREAFFLFFGCPLVLGGNTTRD